MVCICIRTGSSGKQAFMNKIMNLLLHRCGTFCPSERLDPRLYFALISGWKSFLSFFLWCCNPLPSATSATFMTRQRHRPVPTPTKNKLPLIMSGGNGIAVSLCRLLITWGWSSGSRNFAFSIHLLLHLGSLPVHHASKLSL